jgi:hypothetical protein
MLPLVGLRSTVVKTYKTPRQMQRGIERMERRGYEARGQSGGFSSNLWLTPRWRRRKVAVTFQRVGTTS